MKFLQLASRGLLPAMTLWVMVSAPNAAVYNISLTTDNAPDLTDMASYVKSITGYLAPDDHEGRCKAVWRWSQRGRRQTSAPYEDGMDVIDPIDHARYVRLRCKPLEGWGMGLSEIEIYDSVEIRPWPKEITFARYLQESE